MQHSPPFRFDSFTTQEDDPDAASLKIPTRIVQGNTESEGRDSLQSSKPMSKVSTPASTLASQSGKSPEMAKLRMEKHFAEVREPFNCSKEWST